MSRGRWIIAFTFLVLLAITPFLLIARARAVTSPTPRLHVIFDMDNQPKFRAQQANPLFADDREMRLPVEHTLAVEDARDESAIATGKRDGQWLTAIPLPIDEALMRRGQNRFNIYCSPCHGLSGYGDGMIAKRADELAQTEDSKWIPPSSYHTDTVRQRPVGHIFNTITNGIRSMPSYRAQIPVNDRWAIVAYVRALQRSQNATINDVPAEMRQTMQ